MGQRMGSSQIDMSNKDALLRFDSVACQRGGRMLFRGLSFTLNPGDALILSGPNGVGKSSLLRLAAGLLKPFAGQIERSSSLALADENLALDADKSLAAALDFWAKLDGRSNKDVGAALEVLGIVHLADVPVRMLSTGQRKRAVLARTITSDAHLWLLDEPANGLDSESLTRLEGIIANHRANGGAALIASHQSLGVKDAAHITLETPALKTSDWEEDA